MENGDAKIQSVEVDPPVVPHGTVCSCVCVCVCVYVCVNECVCLFTIA